MPFPLTAKPHAGSFQAQFEALMALIGWNRGALAISDCGSYYVNRDVQMHYDAFCQNMLA